MAGEEEAMFITLLLIQVISNIYRMRRRRRFFNRLRLLFFASLGAGPRVCKIIWTIPSLAINLRTGVLENPGWKRFVVGDGGQKDPEPGKISVPDRGLVT